MILPTATKPAPPATRRAPLCAMCLYLICQACATPLQAASPTPQPATTLRETALLARPATDAPELARLEARTALTVTTRQGGWLKVTARSKSGYVRLLHVRMTPTTPSPRSATPLQTGRAGTGNVVATSGIRGLDEESLRRANPDPALLKPLDALALTDQAARHWAALRKLKAVVLDDLPDPADTPKPDAAQDAIGVSP